MSFSFLFMVRMDNDSAFNKLLQFFALHHAVKLFVSFDTHAILKLLLYGKTGSGWLLNYIAKVILPIIIYRIGNISRKNK